MEIRALREARLESMVKYVEKVSGKTLFSQEETGGIPDN